VTSASDDALSFLILLLKMHCVNGTSVADMDKYFLATEAGFSNRLLLSFAH